MMTVVCILPLHWRTYIHWTPSIRDTKHFKSSIKAQFMDTYIGHTGFVCRDRKGTKQALWSVVSHLQNRQHGWLSVLTQKHKAVTVSPKKCQPHQKTRNSKPYRKRSLDSNQNSVRAHQKHRGSVGNRTVHIFVRRLFYMYWRAAHQKQKRKGRKTRPTTELH